MQVGGQAVEEDLGRVGKGKKIFYVNIFFQ